MISGKDFLNSRVRMLIRLILPPWTPRNENFQEVREFYDASFSEY